MSKFVTSGVRPALLLLLELMMLESLSLQRLQSAGLGACQGQHVGKLDDY